MRNLKNWKQRANAVLPAGNFGNLPDDIVIREGSGAYIWDMDGNQYIDYLIGSGPMILGHSHPEVNQAVQEQLSKGSTFFVNNYLGIELAESICSSVACAQKLRFASTGSEADMYAIRLARAHTGRDKIIKFEGGYHGMCNEAQMSLAPHKFINFPQSLADSAGISHAVASDVLIAPYNDLNFLKSLISEYDGQIAGLIIEPLQRTILAIPGFLAGVRELCTQAGIVLIFDEVVTGFRLSEGGAQEHYGVIPDLCTLGKIIGGGFALSAITGPASIMDHFDNNKHPDKFLMQIGTLSGNPIASVAGLKTLEILRRPGQYEKLRAIGKTLWDGIETSLNAHGITHTISGDVSCFDVLFCQAPIRNYRDSRQANAQHSQIFNRVLRENGIYKSAGKIYPSLSLSDNDLEQTLNAFTLAAAQIAQHPC